MLDIFTESQLGDAATVTYATYTIDNQEPVNEETGDLEDVK